MNRGIEVPLANGKRWVIGDIHGCYKTFRKLLSIIQLEEDDQLFLLGDYINKGPSSLKVILEVAQMPQNVFPLLGNHDKLFLDYLLKPDNSKREHLRQLNANDLLDSDQKTQSFIKEFLANLPYFYISEDIILVHAGFNFSIENVFEDDESMITIKEFQYDPDKVSGRRIVHGHFPVELNDIIDALTSKRSVIPLDNGCVYRGDLKGIGNLIAMELNQGLILVQPNIDQT